MRLQPFDNINSSCAYSILNSFQNIKYVVAVEVAVFLGIGFRHKDEIYLYIALRLPHGNSNSNKTIIRTSRFGFSII